MSGALRPLVERLSDGAVIDWDSLPNDADQPGETVAGLRRLARITDAFARCTDRAPQCGAEQSLMWGHLQVYECIGAGSFGQVYRAYDQTLDRDVALKLRREESSALAGTRAFIAEARRLAMVRHRNVLAVHGAAVHNGRVGLWADLLRGQTLAEQVKADGQISVSALPEILDDVLCGLAAIHQAGLIHGDVKASNVMIEADGRAVLMDFGAGAESEQGAARTATVQGSPLCMAPELLDGAPPSQSGDIYAVGVMLYYLCSGRFPVVGESIEQLRQAHRQRSSRKLSLQLPSLPRELSLLLDAMLALSPDARPSASQALAQIRRLQSKPERRKRQMLIVAVVASLSLALAVSLLALQRVSVARVEALSQYQQAEREREHAVAVKDFIVEGVRAAAPLQREDGSSLLGVYRGMAERVDAELGAFPVALGEMRVAIGRGLHDYGDHQAGIALAERGLATLESIAELAPERLIQPLETLAMLYRHQNQLDMAEQSVRRALAIADSSVLEDRQLAALRLRARNLLANVLSDRGELLGALVEHRQVLEERRQLLGPEAVQLAANHNNIGRTLERLERWDEALQAFTNAEGLLLRHGERDSIKLALVRNGMALSLIGSGELQRGEQMLRQTQERFIRDYGREHEFVYATELGLAEAARRGGDPESALRRLDALASDTDYEPSFYFWLLRGRAAADLQRWPAVADSYGHALDSRFVDNQPFRAYLQASIVWAEAAAAQSEPPTAQLQAALGAFELQGLHATAEAAMARQWLTRTE